MSSVSEERLATQDVDGLLGFIEFGKGGDSLRQIETRGDWFGFVGFIEFVEFLEFFEFIGRGP